MMKENAGDVKKDCGQGDWPHGRIKGIERVRSIPGELKPGHFDGLGEASPYRTEHERRNVAFGFYRKAGCLLREFQTPVEPEARFFQELRRKPKVRSAIDTPEPKLFFVALEKAERLLQLFHGTVER